MADKTICSLPLELIVMIIEKLGLTHRIRLASTSKYLRDIILFSRLEANIIKCPSCILKYYGANKSIDLTDCNWITDDDLSNFKGATSVNLSYCAQLTGIGLKYLENIENINLLECNGITDESLKVLKKAHTVNIIGCGNDNLTDNALKNLGSREEGIREIDFLGCQISTNSVKYLRGIRTIRLSGFWSLTDEDSINLSKASLSIDNGGLHTVEIADCEEITDDGLVHLQGIHTINLSRCSKITDTGIWNLNKEVKPRQRRVHAINLSGCQGITDDGLKAIWDAKSVNISQCEHITDASLKHFKKIKVLDLGNCEQITDVGLKNLSETLASRGRTIDTIYLKKCRRITNDGLRYLQGVQNIDLSNCNITNEGLQYLGRDYSQSKKGVLSINLCFCLNLTGLCLSYIKGVRKINLTFCTGEIYCGLHHIIPELLSITCHHSTTDDNLKELKNVEEIILHGCNHVTDKGLSYLEKVSSIELKYCNKITKEGLKYLRNANKITIDKCKNISREDLTCLCPEYQTVNFGWYVYRG